MRCCGLMRCQRKFLSVIPLYKAGYPRVTHPSATKSTKIPSEDFLLAASFDLHVLSTPPAFILSQDQTLMLKVFLDQNYTSNFVSEIFLFLKVFIP